MEENYITISSLPCYRSLCNWCKANYGEIPFSEEKFQDLANYVEGSYNRHRDRPLRKIRRHYGRMDFDFGLPYTSGHDKKPETVFLGLWFALAKHDNLKTKYELIALESTILKYLIEQTGASAIKAIDSLFEVLYKVDEPEDAVLPPDDLSTNEAMAIWNKLKEENLVNDNLQPTVSRWKQAMIAEAFANKLNIKNKWKVFEDFWHVNDMKFDKQAALRKHEYPEFSKLLTKLGL